MGLRAKDMVALVWMAFLLCSVAVAALGHRHGLRFNGKSGEFRILQVADMHYADGKRTPCEDVFPQQMASCSDLNTTAFIRRVIRAEKPDLIVFTGTIYDYPNCYLCISKRLWLYPV